MRDTLGIEHEVGGEIKGFRLLVANEKMSEKQMVPAEPAERLAYEVEQIRKALPGSRPN